ncbi:MAG: hypothetical protein HZB39_12480 [Planctomycetes bacterium]|nr:hypothetical protein [Planctomycetota bacterium]
MKILTPVIVALGLGLNGCGYDAHDGPSWPGVVPAVVQDPDAKVQVPPPPFTEGQFPCSDCHEAGLPVNTTRRVLKTAHEDIVLRHDEQHRWCLDCHDEKDRDKLHLASGETLEFTESYRLCGQCHGDKYRDWRAGVHGRRSGNWNGDKTYLLCVHCHYSHAPAFQPLEPKPAPNAPRGDLR